MCLQCGISRRFMCMHDENQTLATNHIHISLLFFLLKSLEPGRLVPGTVVPGFVASGGAKYFRVDSSDFNLGDEVIVESNSGTVGREGPAVLSGGDFFSFFLFFNRFR